MKPLTIEKTYRKLNQNTVIEYRRIVTPWFYKKLKPRIFKKLNYKSRYCFGYCAETPIFHYKYWKDEKGEELLSKKLIEKLELSNEQANEELYK